MDPSETTPKNRLEHVDEASPEMAAPFDVDADRELHPGAESLPNSAAEWAEESSKPFVGLWNRLVSTTNWEKGRIIVEWREALIEREAEPTAYSDEAWATLVGGVTSQHVGRLRRVYRQFGEVASSYEGLYWTHFQAALDWSDAEMWLEGAVQNGWSVSRMRKNRWEAMGSVPDSRPEDGDIVAADLDEDFEPAAKADPESGDSFDATSAGPRPDGPDFGDEEHVDEYGDAARAEVTVADADASEPSTEELVRPFEGLESLPPDVTEAFEVFKLAILRHKAQEWDEISCDQIVAALESLKTLARAPSGDA